MCVLWGICDLSYLYTEWKQTCMTADIQLHRRQKRKLALGEQKTEFIETTIIGSVKLPKFTRLQEAN